MASWRALTPSVVLVFCLLILAPAVSAAPPADGGPPAWSDAAPERWILGEETVRAEDRDVAERWRVLPGGHLTITESTLRFQAIDGLAGIIAEPGGTVTIASSTLTTDAAGSYLVHLEGTSDLRNVIIEGADAVVVQPRSLTDHGDETLGAHAEHQITGWRLARAASQDRASLSNVTMDAPLTVGVPERYQRAVAETDPVRLIDVRVQTDQGPALTCYETRQRPDADGGPTPIVGGDAASTLTIEGGSLHAETGAVLHCPDAPVPRTLPDRNPPVDGQPLDLPDPVAAPPRPGASVGPHTLTLSDVALSGTGTGLVVDTGTDVVAERLRLDDLSEGVRIAHDAATATLTDTYAVGVKVALNVVAGTIDDENGHYVGAPVTGATGVRAVGGDTTLTGTTLLAFEIGIDDQTGITIDGAHIGPATQCVRARAPTTLTSATLQGCGTGVALEHTTGATITDNTFTNNREPLTVVSLDTTKAHYDHTVTGNTVHGRALTYLFDQHAPNTDTTPTGHLVVAFSEQQRLTDLDLTHGNAHLIASHDIVLGARTDRVGHLLDHFAPLARPAYDTVAAARFEPYEGALIGPRGVMEAAYGNAVDQSWALLDAWESAGYDARFVQGRAGGQTDAFLDWVGMGSPGHALAMRGFDATWFGATYEVDHTWVELEVAPGIHIEVDPSYAVYDWSDPVDLPQLAGFTEDDLYAAMIDGATVDYSTRSVTGLNLAAMEERLLQYRDDGFANLNASRPDGLTGRDLVRLAIPRGIDDGEDIHREPSTRFETLPDDQRWQVRVVTREPGTPADSHIDFHADTADLYGRSLTLESHPDTEAMVDQIIAAGGLYAIDRTSVTYTTYLKVDDEIQDAIGGVATPRPDGSMVWSLPDDPADRAVTYHPGDLVDLAVHLIQPNGQARAVHTSPFRVGGTYAIVLDLAGTPAELVDRRLAAFNDTLHTWAGSPESVNVSQSQLVGELYHIQGLQYFQSLHFAEDLMAADYEARRVPVGSIAVTGTSMLPIIDGGVQKVTPAPPYFDIRNVDDTYPQHGDFDLLVDYRMASGVIASTLEDRTFTEMYDLPAVSTTKAFAAAAANGITIHSLGPGETEAWSHLSLPTPVMQSIANAVNRGWHVITPQTQVNYYDWTGVGWLEYDPQTGSAGWLIYGGTDPVTGALDIDEWPILAGGAGARYGPADNSAFWDSGYLDATVSGLDWTSQGVGLFSDITEKSLKWSNLNEAANIGRRSWDDVALNNQHRALLGKFDVPTKYGNYAKIGGNAAAIVGQSVDMYDIVTSDQSIEAKYIEVAGVTAINIGTMAASTAAIKGGAIGGAWVGGLLFDGPGAAVGAVAGGIGGAVALAVTSGWAKNTFRSWFD